MKRQLFGYKNDFCENNHESEEPTTGEAIDEVYCFNNSWNGEKWEFPESHVTTPMSNYVCENCGSWSLVYKVPFTLQKHLKTTKQAKNALFSRKRWVCYLASKCSIMFQFN